jgi:hypothetical protein
MKSRKRDRFRDHLSKPRPVLQILEHQVNVRKRVDVIVKLGRGRIFASKREEMISKYATAKRESQPKSAGTQT